MNRTFAALLTLCVLALPISVRAQTDGAPIKLIVGVAPGGSLDLTARILSERLVAFIKRPVIVENKPGANMLIATKLVSSSAPDGNTLLVSTVGPMTTNPVLYPKESVDPLVDLTPVSMIVIGRLAVIANPKLPVSTVAELVRHAKSRPGALNYGAGTTTFQVATEMFMEQTGIQLTRIPYSGTAPTLNALLAGQIDLAVLDIGVALPHIKSGKLKALMVLSEQRSRSIPHVPSAIELGFPELEVETWVAIFGPPRLASEIVSRLNGAISRSLSDTQVRERFDSIDFEVVSYPPDQTRNRIQRDSTKFKKVMEKANMKTN